MYFMKRRMKKFTMNYFQEISEMFIGIEGEDASKLYDSLHNQIQYA